VQGSEVVVEKVKKFVTPEEILNNEFTRWWRRRR